MAASRLATPPLDGSLGHARLREVIRERFDSPRFSTADIGEDL
ncbi:MAG: hypothetical protein ACLPX1_10445 [Steroidobacteraceae bacterium]